MDWYVNLYFEKYHFLSYLLTYSDILYGRVPINHIFPMSSEIQEYLERLITFATNKAYGCRQLSLMRIWSTQGWFVYCLHLNKSA